MMMGKHQLVKTNAAGYGCDPNDSRRWPGSSAAELGKLGHGSRIPTISWFE
jgi:hypothetical protein